jgi:hypothetical protein
MIFVWLLAGVQYTLLNRIGTGLLVLDAVDIGLFQSLERAA